MSSARATEQERKDYELRISQISKENIAWFGGWLCADGCITQIKESPKLKFTLCDKDPLYKFSALFGNSVHGPFAPSGFGKLKRYEWSISGWRAVVILNRCLLWLSFRYYRKAIKALENFKPRGHAGRTLNPEKVREIRASKGHGSGVEMAKKFGVSNATVSAIKNNRIWIK